MRGPARVFRVIVSGIRGLFGVEVPALTVPGGAFKDAGRCGPARREQTKRTKPKLKIAQVCPYDIHRPGGVQRHILDLSASLRKLGHDVTILAPGVRSGARAVAGSSACPIVEVGDGRLIALNKTQIEISLAAGDRLARLDEVLQTGGFDVMHFHSMLTPFLPMQIFRRSRGANVATFHEVPPDTRSGPIQRFAYRSLGRWLMPRLDGVILASEVQRHLHRLGAEVTVLPPCTDLRRFEPAAPAAAGPYRDGRVNILFLGRLEPRKGAIILLQAFLALCRRGLPVRLLMAGDGPEAPTLKRFAQAQGLDVLFLGEVADADLAARFAACDIFCAPSPYAEGFGIVLVEAMASGKPIVAAGNAGYRTLLHGEAADLLARPGDAESLRDKLETLINDPHLRHRLGAWGRDEAKRYDCDICAPSFVAVYEEAIRAKARREKPRVAAPLHAVS